jgi:hypothetical protein
MTAPPTIPTTPEPPVMCISCGYALAGLADDGVCPECATSVAGSIAAYEYRYPTPRHISDWRWAVTVLLNAITIALLTVCFGFTFFSIFFGGGAMLIGGAILFACWATWQAGWWTLASKDPTLLPHATPPASNRALRRLTLFSVALPMLTAVISLSTNVTLSSGVIWPLAAMCILPTIAQVAIGTTLLARIAPRFSPARRRWRRNTRMWLQETAIAAFVVFVAAILVFVIDGSAASSWLTLLTAALLALSATLMIALIVQLLFVLTSSRGLLRASHGDALLRIAVANERTTGVAS